MEKSLSLNRLFTNAEFYDRFALAAEAGFTHVELGEWTDLDITRVSEELQEHGLRLASVLGADHDLSKNDTHSDFGEHLSQSVAVAKVFGCTQVIIESAIGAGFGVNAGDTTMIAREDLLNAAIATRILMAAAQRAERAGITLFLKPPLSSPMFLPALRLTGNVVAAVNSPAMKLLLDATGLWLCRNEPEAAQVMRRVHKFIGYVHIGENSNKDEWKEELAWFKRHVAAFYELDCTVGLLYPATIDDSDILQSFLAL